MKIASIAVVLAVALAADVSPVRAQNAASIDAIIQRLDQLERQNADLREQLTQMQS